jgi:hypothetical protein
MSSVFFRTWRPIWGHVSLRETSRYLTMTKELLDEASHRFELYASPGGKQ